MGARIIEIARCIIADTAKESNISRFAIGFRNYIGNWENRRLICSVLALHGLRCGRERNRKYMIPNS